MSEETTGSIPAISRVDVALDELRRAIADLSQGLDDAIERTRREPPEPPSGPAAPAAPMAA